MKSPSEGRTASAWQHHFRDVKKNAVKMVKGYESAKEAGNGTWCSKWFSFNCRIELRLVTQRDWTSESSFNWLNSTWQGNSESSACGSRRPKAVHYPYPRMLSWETRVLETVVAEDHGFQDCCRVKLEYGEELAHGRYETRASDERAFARTLVAHDNNFGYSGLQQQQSRVLWSPTTTILGRGNVRPSTQKRD